MRAVVCTRLAGEDGLDVTSAHPEPGALEPDRVRIAVRAASVNFPDVLVTRGEYQIKPPLPFVLGNECAGDVVAVGADVTGHAVGDRVLALTGIATFPFEQAADAVRTLRDRRALGKTVITF